MKKGDFLQHATNPHQYDSAGISYDGSTDSPTRRFFQEQLRPHLEVKEKSVVDIGSGKGQLFPFLKELGASEIQGIEPSLENFKVSRESYPDVDVFNGTLDNFSTSHSFQIATAIMVFEHIYDLQGAFAKINKILSKDGRFFLIVADKEYHLTPRFGYQIEAEDLNNGEVVAKTLRPIGILYDILRPLSHYVEAAEKNDFALEKHVELKPTKILIDSKPGYSEFMNKATTHLLIFRKSS